MNLYAMLFASEKSLVKSAKVVSVKTTAAPKTKKAAAKKKPASKKKK